MLPRAHPDPPRAITILFSLTAFLSACLMFVIEPLVGKALLPDFGGGSSVWAAVLVFFQLAVLAGYGFGYLAIARLGLERAAALLLVVGIVGALLSPSTPRMLDLDLGPLARVLLTLAASYGPAVVALACAAPCLQYWYARRVGQLPFSLYAIGNAGSLAGLALYPSVLEPLLGITMQGTLWRLAYMIWLATLATCAYLAMSGPPTLLASLIQHSSPDEARPTAARRAAWVVLAAIPASLLLGVTQHLTFDIAPFPLLWTLPLGLYLLTVVAAFASPAKTFTRGQVYQACAIPPLVVLALMPLVEGTMPVRSIVMHLVGFAGCAMLCHGRLAQLNPGPGRQPEFYLLVSFGAALGGLFNTVVAPLLFDRLAEYPLMLAASCLVAQPLLRRRLPRELALLPALLLFGLVVAHAYGGDVAGNWLVMGRTAFIAVAMGCAALAVCTSRIGIALVCVVGLVLPIYLPPTMDGREIYASRDFYGPLRVSEQNGVRTLIQGSTVQSIQFAESASSRVPSGYVGRNSGIGRLIDVLKGRVVPDGAAIDIAVVGLGSGAFSCYGDTRARVSFVENDPGVVAMARRAFTFLAQCGDAPVEMGDGRARLAARADASLDLIVVRAFAADALPAHLITAEAVRLYLSKLRPGGAVAINLRHHFLDLAPVIAGSAGWNDATALHFAAAPPAVAMPSDWAVVTTDIDLIDRLTRQGWTRMPPTQDATLWRDDKWDLTHVLKMSAGQ